MISICPFCQSQLAVSKQQLAAADGIVRCGSCMRTFSVHNDAEQYEKTQRNAPQINEPVVGKALIREQFADLPSNNPATKAEHDQLVQSSGSRTLDDGRVEPVLLAAAHTADLLLTTIDSQKKGWPAFFRGAAKCSLRILTLILCCILAALLLLQGLKPAIEVIPSWQPLQQGYALACRYLQCNRPAQTNDYRTNKLQIHNQQVAHNGLLIETEITNISDQALPYPLLLLYFSTLHGDRQASRLFEPADYMPNNNSGNDSLLAAKAALNIRLSIVDPGAEFTSYAIELLPPI
jgi:predicted Zn finger-like uncharacterized protein